jgi:class 3 adenylate cyclase
MPNLALEHRMVLKADNLFGRVRFRERAPALATQRIERRLAAILAADIAGYSRLMGADQEGTLARLKAHRCDLIDPKIGEHKGRIAKATGDGMLIEFPSIVDSFCKAGLPEQ